MAKGKSAYQFTIINPASADQIIQQWLTANQFQPISEDGSVYYQSGDALSGYRGFEYQISGNNVAINAYLGSFKKPMQLSDGLVGSLPIAAYKNKLNELFSVLNNMPSTSNEPAATPSATTANTAPTASVNSQPNSQPTNIPDFQQSVDKKNATFAEISFWVSLAMLLTAFTGVIYGAIIVIFNYWMAVQGLKSKKRGKAIAAIVISTAAIIVFVVKLIIEINK